MLRDWTLLGAAAESSGDLAAAALQTGLRAKTVAALVTVPAVESCSWNSSTQQERDELPPRWQMVQVIKSSTPERMRAG